MARGTAFLEIVQAVRDELRRASSPDDSASVKATVNHNYEILYLNNDWPFLQTQFDGITLAAGQRFYDFPTGLDPERVIKARVLWSNNYVEIERGISEADYNAYDPAQDQRTAPVLKWDVRFTGTNEQIEVWPIPDGTVQSLHLFGIYKFAKLVNDADTCRLDGTLIQLYSAAELLPKDSPDKDAKLQLAKELLRTLKARGNSGAGKRFTNGLGVDTAERVHPRAIVRIGG